MSSVYLLISHGSREEESNQAFRDLVEEFRKKEKRHPVVGAFLELAHPLIPEAIGRCVQSGAKEITIIPLMLFWGRHVKQDIPKIMEEAQRRHPGVGFHYAGPLANGSEFLSFLEEHICRMKGGK